MGAYLWNASVKTAELFLFGIAAVIDLALLMALLERVNRGRVAIWLKSLVASVAMVHTAVFLRLLLADASGQTIQWIDRLLIVCISAGLFALPSAMLHAAVRLHTTGMLANPVRDLRYGILYLPLISIPVIAMSAFTEAQQDFMTLVTPWTTAYLAWMVTANFISITLFLRLRWRPDFSSNRSFLTRLVVGIATITVLCVFYVAMPKETSFEDWFRLLLILSPLAVALLFVWHSQRGKLLPLVMERTLGYAVILIGMLLAHRLVVSPLAAMLRSRTNLDFYLLEGMFLALVILFVPALRRRVAESLRYLFSTNVNHVRQATRNLSLKLSQNATLDREDLIEWFASELRESIALDHVSILVGDTGSSVAPQIKRMPSLLLSSSQVVQNDALLSLAQLVIGFGRIVERGDVNDTKLDDALAAENAIVIFPLAYRSVNGMVVFGNRVRNDRLSREQLYSLSLIIDQFAATLHNRQDELLRQRAERKMLQQEKLSVLGLLSGSLAHELRNPLSSIRTIATLTLEELGSGHPCEHDLKLIISEVDRLSQTTNRLLDYARPEAVAHSLVRPDQVIQRIVSILSYLARQNQIELVACLECEHVEIASNESSLCEIVFNLIKNAIEAVRDIESGSVSVTTGIEAGWFLITVADNGPGIAEELRTTLFKPFASYKVDGNGLGLYAAAERVRELGGTINFESSDSSGTIFQVRVPSGKQ